MRLLARYLLRECLVALGFCFSAFLILWIALDLLSELDTMQENRMTGFDVAEYYFFRLPEFLPVALPVALLLALLYAITTHARHNEITAIRAAGVSLWRLSLPYFAVGLVSAATMFVSNEFVTPKTSDIAEEVKARRIPQSQATKQRARFGRLDFNHAGARRFWHSPAYNPRTGEMLSPVLDWPMSDGSKRTIFAERAVHTNGLWTFFHVREVRQIAGTDSFVKSAQTNVMVFPEFTETPAMIRSVRGVAERFDHQSKTQRADIPIDEIRTYLKFNPRPKPQIRSWINTKLHGRFAAPFTCLAVVFLAVPFAAGSGRRNVFVGVGASISIFFIYFLFQQLGFAYGQAGRIPAWIGAWLPNILVAVTGVCLMAKVR